MNSKLRLSLDGETTSCFSCLRLIGVSTVSTNPNKAKGDEVLRYVCPDCKNVFCVDCDSFLHETLHNCPGCLLR
jgi:transcription initiation factor TFIIH subunit 2